MAQSIVFNLSPEARYMKESKEDTCLYQKCYTNFPLDGTDRFVSINRHWGCSSVGRALVWQTRGHGFDPRQLHHFLVVTEGSSSAQAVPDPFVPLQA